MKWLILFGTVLSTGCSLIGIRNEEVPNYKVVHTEGAYEIREYETYLIAETTVEGDYDEATNEGFRRLAGYIFGKNIARSQVREGLQAKKVSSEKMAMTAPVEMVKSQDSSWIISFVMPSEYNMETLPVPKDPRISIREIKNRKTAVYKAGGFHSETKMENHAELLKKWLEQQNVGEPSQSSIMVYDPPWTIPFLRRTEISLELNPG